MNSQPGKAVFHTSYWIKLPDFVERSVFSWEQVTEGFFIFGERFENFTLVVLNNVTEVMCKYKLF